ncbi:MAG TPA: phosphatase PAP2 family protein [Gemmatimonadaceae bacterium]|nr:phosphatase PAP2 family protein [Gemmatimonadaceae bacterium]
MHHRPHTIRGAAGLAALLAIVPVTGTPLALAQTPAAAPTPSLFTWNDVWLAGVFVGGTLLLRPTDQRWAERLQNPRNQSNRFLQDVAKGVRTITEPGAFIIGGSLYTIGRLSKQRDMADLGLHGTEAIIVGSVVATVLKDAFGRARPYVHPPTDSTGFNPNDWQLGRGLRGGDQYRSFPSGHSVAAFAAAAAVTNEAGRWWPSYQWLVGSAMFGGATLVGISRMYNNKHWSSDVMLGAAIGIFAGNKVVRYHHRTNPGNRFDKWLLAGSLSPRAGGGFALSWMAIPGVSLAPAGR